MLSINVGMRETVALRHVTWVCYPLMTNSTMVGEHLLIMLTQGRVVTVPADCFGTMRMLDVWIHLFGFCSAWGQHRGSQWFLHNFRLFRGLGGSQNRTGIVSLECVFAGWTKRTALCRNACICANRSWHHDFGQILCYGLQVARSLACGP